MIETESAKLSGTIQTNSQRDKRTGVFMVILHVLRLRDTPPNPVGLLGLDISKLLASVHASLLRKTSFLTNGKTHRDTKRANFCPLCESRSSVTGCVAHHPQE